MSAVFRLQYEKERLEKQLLNYIDYMSKADDEFKAFSLKTQIMERRLIELNDFLVSAEFDKDKQELLITAKLTRENFTSIQRRLDVVKNNGDENLSKVKDFLGTLDDEIRRTPPHFSVSEMFYQISLIVSDVNKFLSKFSEIEDDLISVREGMLDKLMLLKKRISAKDIDYEYLDTDSLG